MSAYQKLSPQNKAWIREQYRRYRAGEWETPVMLSHKGAVDKIFIQTAYLSEDEIKAVIAEK